MPPVRVLEVRSVHDGLGVRFPAPYRAVHRCGESDSDDNGGVDKPTTRREFVKIGVAATALSLCGGCALFVTKRRPDLILRPEAGEIRFDEAKLEPAGSLVVAVEGQKDKLLVFRLPGGDVAAVTTKCTHKGCDVGYSEEKNRIVCPCHGSEYDTKGSNLEGPAKRPLRAYAVRIDRSSVVVRVS